MTWRFLRLTNELWKLHIKLFIQFFLPCIQMISPIHVVGGIRVVFKHVCCTTYCCFPLWLKWTNGLTFKTCQSAWKWGDLMYPYTLSASGGAFFFRKKCFVSKELDVYFTIFRQTWALPASPSNRSAKVVQSSRIQTSTRSSGNMGCWSCCGFTCCNGYNMNTIVLRTPAGILKIFEFVVVLICLMLARFGGVDSHPLHFGTDNEKFLGIGCMVGYAIIVPAILGTYLMGATHTFLELFINFVGGVLFITSGALTIQSSKGSYHKDSTRMALGCLCIVAGILFLIDFLFSVKNTRVTVVTTRRTVIWACKKFL